MQEKHWLIVYDIRDAKRLSKISRCVQSFAWRVQKSVFETRATAETISIFKSKVEKLMDLDTDFILFFELCECDWQKKEIFGKTNNNSNLMNVDEDFVIL